MAPVRAQRPQNATPWRGVRTQRPTHLPLAGVELRYKAFKSLVEENQTLATLKDFTLM